MPLGSGVDSFVDKTVRDGNIYEYRMKVVTATEGESEWSEPQVYAFNAESSDYYYNLDLLVGHSNSVPFSSRQHFGEVKEFTSDMSIEVLYRTIRRVALTNAVGMSKEFVGGILGDIGSKYKSNLTLGAFAGVEKSWLIDHVKYQVGVGKEYLVGTSSRYPIKVYIGFGSETLPISSVLEVGVQSSLSKFLDLRIGAGIRRYCFLGANIGRGDANHLDLLINTGLVACATVTSTRYFAGRELYCFIHNLTCGGTIHAIGSTLGLSVGYRFTATPRLLVNLGVVGANTSIAFYPIRVIIGRHTEEEHSAMHQVGLIATYSYDVLASALLPIRITSNTIRQLTKQVSVGGQSRRDMISLIIATSQTGRKAIAMLEWIWQTIRKVMQHEIARFIPETNLKGNIDLIILLDGGIENLPLSLQGDIDLAIHLDGNMGSSVEVIGDIDVEVCLRGAINL